MVPVGTVVHPFLVLVLPDSLPPSLPKGCSLRIESDLGMDGSWRVTVFGYFGEKTSVNTESDLGM